MQMGRWFGFREGYEDLCRIYTTPELAGWFSDLAVVEHRLREDIAIYESMGLTPYEVGLRIWQHPVMEVTNRLKRRFATSTTISQSYALSLEQTFKFPLTRPNDLAVQSEANRLAVKEFLFSFGQPASSDNKGPIWMDVAPDDVTRFLRNFRVDEAARSISLPLIIDYIERSASAGELRNWTVAVRGRESLAPDLGTADWGLSGGPIPQISRSRIGATDSLGVITSPGDEFSGLAPELQVLAEATVRAARNSGTKKSENRAAREVRPSQNGLLLLYPISRFSAPDKVPSARRPIFADPNGPEARDLVGLAISFPQSAQPQPRQAFVEGTVAWRPAE
jgi:hypothetical protein